MGLSKREDTGARKWRSGGDAGVSAYPSQPSATLWLSLTGPLSSSGDDRHRSIARRSSPRSVRSPTIRSCPIATLGTTSSLVCAPSTSRGAADEHDISSSIGFRTRETLTSSDFCTTRWTSACTFPRIWRLADPSNSVERVIYRFDTHLTPNDANFAESWRRKCHTTSSQKTKTEFKTTPGG